MEKTKEGKLTERGLSRLIVIEITSGKTIKPYPLELVTWVFGDFNESKFTRLLS